jgi:nicotinate-nucleotide adenylyltransferase
MSESDQLRIGIMGGTFDPIHFGHLITAEEVRVQFGLDQVIFVPCGVPPHKKKYDLTDARHRHVMVELAVADNPHFTTSRVEIDRQGPAYTIDTIRTFRERFGDACQLYFITGADAILEMLTWRDNESLIELCRFVAATRPGYELSELDRRLGPRHRARIDSVSVPGIEISSTDIRRRVSQGKPIQYLTPSATVSYIKKHALYQQPQQSQPSP